MAEDKETDLALSSIFAAEAGKMPHEEDQFAERVDQAISRRRRIRTFVLVGAGLAGLVVLILNVYGVLVPGGGLAESAAWAKSVIGRRAGLVLPLVIVSIALVFELFSRHDE